MATVVRATWVHLLQKTTAGWTPRLMNIPFRDESYLVVGDDLQFIRDIGALTGPGKPYATVTDTDGGWTLVRVDRCGYRVFASGVVECTGADEDPALARALIARVREYELNGR